MGNDILRRSVTVTVAANQLDSMATDSTTWPTNQSNALTILVY